MKFTSFILAAAAASAGAQMAYNPYATQQFYNPYGVQYNPYALNQFTNQDPLAWERDCSWIQPVQFRAMLSRATCGYDVCDSTRTPNGNGGGRMRGVSGDDSQHVWGSVINRAGRVCAIAYTGQFLISQFAFGRIQSLKRANTANSLSLPGRAQGSRVGTTLGVFVNGGFSDVEYNSESGATGPDGADTPDEGFDVSVDPDGLGLAAVDSDDLLIDDFDTTWTGFTLDNSPGNVGKLHAGFVTYYGEACGSQNSDPMCMQKVGGYDYSAGGLPLYDAYGVLRGAIGVAGDNDCASHAVAWKARQQLGMHHTPVNTDRATYGGHATCAYTSTSSAQVSDDISIAFYAAFTAATSAMLEIGDESALPNLFPNAAHCDIEDDALHANFTDSASAEICTNVASGSDTQVCDSAKMNSVFGPVPAEINGNILLCNECNSINEDNQDGPDGSYPLGLRSHAGSFAEDNVIFGIKEFQNFPACYEIVKRFPQTNPTAQAAGVSK